MDLKHLARIVPPSQRQHVEIDDSRLMYAIDANGDQVKDSSGKSVPIAPDRISGKWYAKVADSWAGEDQTAFEKKGAVHHHSQRAEHRGVWMPLDATAAKAETAPSGKTAPAPAPASGGGNSPQGQAA